MEPKSTYWTLLALFLFTSVLRAYHNEAILKISKMLLRAGADPSKQNRFGSTSLLVATVKQNFSY